MSKTFNLPNVITEKEVIDYYGLFSVLDRSMVNDNIDIKNLEASEKLLNFVIRNTGWSGYKKNIDNQIKIGYNTSVGVNGKGQTEKESYNIWIEQFKDCERRFKKLFPLKSLSQSQYDGMLSLYWFTGNFNSVGTDERNFYLLDFIKQGKWDYVATSMVHSGNNRLVRQNEAKIIMLADYGVSKDRTTIKEHSIQQLVKEYPNRMIDDVAREQAEYVYFVETKRFLPGMAESRKRLLSKQLG